MPHFLSIAAILRNESAYILEWLAFHLVVGVEYFYLYDNESEDGLKEFLDPYIKEEIVYYAKWPPREEPQIDWNDDALEGNFRDEFSRCIANNEKAHRQFPCQKAAFNDAVWRARGKVRWLATFDIDEFVYLPEEEKAEFSQALIRQ